MYCNFALSIIKNTYVPEYVVLSRAELARLLDKATLSLLELSTALILTLRSVQSSQTSITSSNPIFYLLSLGKYHSHFPLILRCPQYKMISLAGTSHRRLVLFFC